jgi:hypothetical protein
VEPHGRKLIRLDSRTRDLFETTDSFEAVVNWLEQHCGPVSKSIVLSLNYDFKITRLLF